MKKLFFLSFFSVLVIYAQTPAPFGNVLRINGGNQCAINSSSYLAPGATQIPDASTSAMNTMAAPITIEFLYHSCTTVDSTSYGAFFFTGNSSNGTAMGLNDWNFDPLEIFTRIYVMSVINIQESGGGSGVPSSGWHHVVFEFKYDISNNRNIVYVGLDGNLIVFNPIDNTNFNLWKGYNFSIGKQPTGLGPFDIIPSMKGNYDELRITRGSRYNLCGEVPGPHTLTIPTSEFVPDANTFALWHFNEGAGDTIMQDASSNNYDLKGIFGATTVNPYNAATLYTTNVDTVCSGEIISLINTGQSITWTPNFGISNPSIANPSITLADTSESYLISTLDMNTCNIYSDSLTLVNLGSGNVFVDSVLFYCQGDSVFLDAGPGFTSYNWSNGSTSSSIWASASGTYWVEVNLMGCTYTDSVEVSEYVPGDLFTDTMFVCPGTAYYYLDAGYGYSSYLWSNGDTTENTVFYTTGWHSVIVTDGCTFSDSIYITEVPSLDLIPDSASYCEGDAVTINAVSGYGSYLWSTGSMFDYIFADSAGLYTVEVDTNDCTYIDSIWVSQFPVLDILQDSISFCPGESILVDAGAGFTYYSWSVGATTQSISINLPGIYSIDAGMFGCIYHDTTWAVEAPGIDVDLGADIFSCYGDTIYLNPVVTGTADSYLWNDGSTASSVYSFNPQDTLWVEVTSAYGCTASDTVYSSMDTISHLHGIIYTHDLNPFVSTSVYAVTFDTTLMDLVVVDSTSTNSLGEYDLYPPLIPVAVLVVPDSLAYPNEAPTYHYNDFIYYTDSAIFVNGCIDTTLNFAAIELATITGTVNIPGIFIIGGRSIGDPIANTRLYLVNDLGQPVKVSKTNSSGQFSFNQLSPGDYEIWTDMPEIDNSMAPSITVTGTDTILDIIVGSFVDHLEVIQIQYAGVEQDHTIPMVMYAYPNPADNEIFIRNPDATEMQLSVLNSLGQSILVENFISDLTLDCSTWPAGLYLIEYRKNGEMIGLQKLIIR